MLYRIQSRVGIIQSSGDSTGIYWQEREGFLVNARSVETACELGRQIVNPNSTGTLQVEVTAIPHFPA